MKKILVATDFSKCASRAMAYATNLAVAGNLELITLHTIMPADVVDNNVYNLNYLSDCFKDKQNYLSKWNKTFNKRYANGQLNITGYCEVGGLRPVMEELIEKLEIDLVVMGARGLAGVKSLMGNHASMISTSITHPVLFISQNTKFVPKPKLAFGVESTNKLTKTSMDALVSWIKIMGIDAIHLVQIASNSNEKSDVFDFWANEFSFLETHSHLIHEEDPVKGLKVFSESTEMDFLGIISHHHNPLFKWLVSSNTEKLVKSMAKSIFVVRD